MKSILRRFARRAWRCWASPARPRDHGRPPPLPRTPRGRAAVPGHARSPPLPGKDPLLEFVPKEHVPADSAVSFPVDI